MRRSCAARQQPAGRHLALGLAVLRHWASSSPPRSQYRKAIAQDGDLTEAYLGLASALSERDLHEAAEQTYRQAIRARPRYWASYDAYGTYLATEGRPADAITSVSARDGARAGQRDRASNLGAAYFLLGDFGNAAAAFRRSVEIAPTGEGYSNLATMYYFDGRYDEAVAMFERAVKLAPQDHSLWGNLADAYRYSTAKKALAPATTRRQPTSPAKVCASIPRRRSCASATGLLPRATGTAHGSRGRTRARGRRGLPRPCTSLLRCAWRTSRSATPMPPFRS